jgi:hypothetical protein
VYKRQAHHELQKGDAFGKIVLAAAE